MENLVQRWKHGRDSYRPAGETIDANHYEVAAIPDDNTAKAFVCEHHYSGSFPAARFRFGLYRSGELVGVSVFSQPFPAALGQLPGVERVELGRFVLLDNVPANGETWFLARCFELLRGSVETVLSFSDPMARKSAAGHVVFGGHIGTIYQAHNAVYLGQAPPRTIRLLPDGSVLSARALSKVRARERGWRYAAAVLERYGAAPLTEADDSRAWLATWVPRVSRTARHPGNFKYAWAVDKRLRKMMPASQPYPKASAQLAVAA